MRNAVFLPLLAVLSFFPQDAAADTCLTTETFVDTECRTPTAQSFNDLNHQNCFNGATVEAQTTGCDSGRSWTSHEEILQVSFGGFLPDHGPGDAQPIFIGDWSLLIRDLPDPDQPAVVSHTHQLFYVSEDATGDHFAGTTPPDDNGGGGGHPPGSPPPLPSPTGNPQQDLDGQTLGSAPTSSDGTPLNTASPGQCSAGDPCNISNGAFWHVETDFSLPTRVAGLSLGLRRVYTAQAVGPAGDFGPNWRHAFETALFSDPAVSGGLVWLDENGGPWTFAPLAGGSFQAPPGQFAILTNEGDHYRLRKPDGRVLIFAKGDAATSGAPPGKLLSIQDPHGESISLSYGNDGRLLSLSNAVTGAVTLGRDTRGRVTSTTRVRDGLSCLYSYGADGRLASYTDVMGHTTTYGYTSNRPNTFAQGMLSTITDPVGRQFGFLYYDDGRIYQQIEPGPAARTYAYSGMGGSTPATLMTDVDGQQTQFHFDSRLLLTEIDLPGGARRLQEWNSSRELVTVTDELGFSTHYSYDERGNRTSTTLPDGTVTQVAYDPTWNRPTSLVPPLGAPTAWTLNPDTGDVVTQSRAGGTQGILALTLGRDLFGGLTSVANGLGTYAYGRDGRGLIISVPDSHNPQTVTYDSRMRVATRSFGSGRIQTYSWDDLDRLTRLTDSNGPEERRQYDAAGRLTSVTRTDGTVAQTTAYTWDGRDRLLTMKDAQGHLTRFDYDRLDPSSGARFVLPGPISRTDAQGHVTRYEYDVRDRLLRETDARGGMTLYGYNLRGDLTRVTDPGGRATSFGFDANGRLVSKVEPIARTVATSQTVLGNTTTQYAYDAASRLIREEHWSQAALGARAVIEYTFDPFDRLVRRVQKRVNASGAVTAVEDDSTYQYRAQLDRTLLSEADNWVERLSFAPEAAPPFALTGFGIQAAPGMSGLGLVTGTFALIRDGAGEISAVKDSAGKTIWTAAHDPAGRLTHLASGSTALLDRHAGPLSVDLSYDSFGRENGLAYSDGTVAAREFDSLDRLASLQWTRTDPRHPRSRPRTLLQEEVGYDEVGQIVSEGREWGDLKFAYDSLGQLASVDPVRRHEELRRFFDVDYQYDSAGNRIKSSLAGSATFLSNQILSQGHVQYQSDVDGFGTVSAEVDSDGAAKRYTYRTDGHLTGFTLSWDGDWDGDDDDDGTVITQASYLFDALGRRVAKQLTERKWESCRHGKGYRHGRFWHGRGRHLSNSAVSFVQGYTHLGLEDRIFLSKAGDGSVHLYLDGSGIDEHLGHVSARDSGAFVTDHLGSATNGEAAGPAGTFGPWGERLIGHARAPGRNSEPVEYGFTGRQLDSESGQYHFRAREYDPRTGRFLSQDPKASTRNKFAAFRYGENNPILNIDPMGTDATVYMTPPPIPHAVISVTNPASSTGVTYYEFFPAENAGLGIGTPVKGSFNSSSNYDFPLIPLNHYALTVDQDKELRDRANAISSLPGSLYPYTPLPGITDLPFLPGSVPGKNCFSFTTDVCGGTCK